MAKVTNAFSTYAAKGNREDLSNAIYNIDPSDRPFMTMIGSRDASNRTFDWQTESLPALNLGNAKEEGFELVRSASTPTVRQTNVAQISSRDATVAGSQEAANAAGKRGEMSHQIALVGKALARDQEAILCSDQPRVDGDDAGVARKTRAAEHWIATNASYGAGGSNPVSATAPITNGTQRDFTEGLLANVIQLAYENGAEPSVLLMGPYQKRVFSTFKGRADSERTVKGDEIVATVDFYRSDFGDMKALPSRWIRTRTVLGIDPPYFKKASYRALQTVNIAKIGDADTKMLVVEYGLECSNEKAHFKIADLTTSGNTALPLSVPQSLGPQGMPSDPNTVPRSSLPGSVDPNQPDDPRAREEGERRRQKEIEERKGDARKVVDERDRDLKGEEREKVAEGLTVYDDDASKQVSDDPAAVERVGKDKATADREAADKAHKDEVAKREADAKKDDKNDKNDKGGGGAGGKGKASGPLA